MRAISTKCPVAPAHGNVLALKDGTSTRYGWYCSHAEHDGRLNAHPQGPAPASRALFTTAEVEAGALEQRHASR